MQRIRMAFAIRFYYDYSFYPSKRIEIVMPFADTP